MNYCTNEWKIVLPSQKICQALFVYDFKYVCTIFYG